MAFVAAANIGDRLKVELVRKMLKVSDRNADAATSSKSYHVVHACTYAHIILRAFLF